MSETEDESHFSSRSVVEINSSECFVVGYMFEKFLVEQCSYRWHFGVKTSNSSFCVLALFTMFTLLLHNFCHPLLFNTQISVFIIVVVVIRKPPQQYYIFNSCFSRLFRCFKLVCHMNSFGFMFTLKKHSVLTGTCVCPSMVDTLPQLLFCTSQCASVIFHFKQQQVSQQSTHP